MEEHLHMTKGDGQLSYSQNSSVQMKAWLMNKHRLESTIQSLISEDKWKSKGLNVADLGCGVGPVPLALVTLVLQIMQKRFKELKHVTNEAHQVPYLHMYMNDLPSNDFSLLFKDVLNLEVLKAKDNNAPSCFLMGVPGSYYGILFPQNSLHFVHASYSLHWLSQVQPGIYNEQGMPLNKGNVYISETSSKEVAQAYLAQFEQDFTQFLACRSKEVLPNGCMLLTLRGRPCSTDSLTWTSFELKIFTDAFTCLVSEGIIKEEALDNFNFPCYHASTEQLESIVEKEGSFVVEDSKTMVFDVAPEIKDKWGRAKIITKFIRAFSESLVSRHFGEDVVSPLYDKLLHQAFQYLDHGHPAQTMLSLFYLGKSNCLEVNVCANNCLSHV